MAYEVDWPDAEAAEAEVQRLAAEYKQARDDHGAAEKEAEAIDAPYDEQIAALEDELRALRNKKFHASKDAWQRARRLEDAKDRLREQGEKASKRLSLAQARGVVPSDWEEAASIVPSIAQAIWDAIPEEARRYRSRIPTRNVDPIKRPVKVAGYAVWGVLLDWGREKFYVAWDRKKRLPVGCMYIEGDGEAHIHVEGNRIRGTTREGSYYATEKPLQAFVDALHEHRFGGKV